MPGLAHNCRWHRIHEGTVSSFAFAYRGAKVRISEQNAKGKFVFLFIFEREYLRCSQRYSKNRRKTSLDALFSLFLTIWYGDNILTQNGEQLKTEKQYKAACDRINELLKVVSNDTPADDKNMLELDLISDLVADYEEEHYPVAAPTLVETIKLRMYEMGLTQTKLAEMLGLSPARISEIITGKGEPSLKTGREISRKLNIDPAIVLGV